MRILALDLGTKTGWAVSRDGKLFDCGTWTLATAKEITEQAKRRFDRRLDSRVSRLWGFLRTTHACHGLEWITFEDVQFSSTTMQTQLWSSFRAAVWVFAHYHNIQTECLGVQKLKQFATGHGGATKEMMSAHLITGSDPRFFLDSKSAMPQFHGLISTKILDDNAVDAVHLLKWSMKTLKNA